MKWRSERDVSWERCAHKEKETHRELSGRMIGRATFLVAVQMLAAAVMVSPAMAQGNSVQVLHNEDVIQMVHAKLSDGLIVAKIKSSPCKFNTSTSELIKLKSEGVSDAVLKAMAECGAQPPGQPLPQFLRLTPIIQILLTLLGFIF